MTGERGLSTRHLLAAAVILSLVALGASATTSYGPVPPVVGPDQTASGGSDAFAAARADGRAHVVAPHPNSTTAIWPYTSRAKSVDTATLPINVVVLAEKDLVRSMLIHRPDATWEDQRGGLNGTRDLNATSNGTTVETNGTEATVEPTDNGTTPAPNATETTLSPNGTETTLAPDGTETTPESNDSSPGQVGDESEVVPVAVNATGVYWSDASGSKRYTYVRSGQPGSGRWIEETDQLHDGDYFGTRYHIRFYEVPDGENSWTALQVHREHFDWFRLRHTVGSLPHAQHYVETQFYDQWYVSDLHKKRFTGGGILNFDGWVTVVEIRYPDAIRSSLGVTALLSGGVFVGLVSGWASVVDRRRVRELTESVPLDPRFPILALSTAAIPLFVRVGSLAVEDAAVVNSPKVVAGVFYPFLAIGLPVCAYVLARGLDHEEAFIAAVGGLGAGFLADYLYLGIELLPVEVVLHRAALLIAIGIVAVAGANRTERRAARDPALFVGVGLWFATLLWALFFW